MGNTSSNSQIQSQLISKYWYPIKENLYCNKLTNEIIKRKKLAFQTEQQMNYVFNTLLKRMNNYNSNVIKIFYIKKNIQSNSSCNCGKKYTILVYIENVETNLYQFLKQKSNLSLISNFTQLDSYSRQCLCLYILKGCLYLKERYGAFKISDKNIWIQLTNLRSQKEKREQSEHSEQKITNVKIKIKVWVSELEEQNYPDESCQEKTMCQSFINLVKNKIIENKLCKCFKDKESLMKLQSIHSFKDLAEKVRKIHDQREILKHSNVQSVLNTNRPKNYNFITQRTFKSFSSYQPTPQSNYHRVSNNLYQVKDSSRKYSSIQYVKKPFDKHYLNMTQQKPSKNNCIQSFHHDPTSFNNYSLLSKQNLTFQNINSTNQINPNALGVNKYISQKIQIQNHPTLQQIRCAQIFNNKIKCRHGNNYINKPIICINGSLNNQNRLQTVVLNHSNFQEVKLNGLKQNKYISNVPSFIKINQQIKLKTQQQPSKRNSQLLKKNVEVSFSKRTDPTDRTKFDFQLKDQSKKQISVINSSRKNISINPISLDSTYGATSSFKPMTILKSFKDNEKQINEQIDVGLLHSYILEDKSQNKEQRKQSASSSKSQKGHYTSHHASAESLDQKAKIQVKKRMSNQICFSLLDQQNIPQSSLGKKSHSFVKKTQSINLVIQNNNQIGRLRQSEYFISGKHCQINEKEISIQKQVNKEKLFGQSKKITSLGQMAAQFKTQYCFDQMMVDTQRDLYYGENLDFRQQLKEIEKENYLQQKQFYEEDGTIQQNKQGINVKGDQKESVSKKENQNMLKKIEQQRENKLQNQVDLKKYFQKQQNIKQLQIQNLEQKNIKNYLLQSPQKICSLVMRQLQEPLQSVDHNQEQYRIRITTSQQKTSIQQQSKLTHPNKFHRKNQEKITYIKQTQNTSGLKPKPQQYSPADGYINEQKKMNQNPPKSHHKKLSNPTFDKIKISKNKSLKQEFGSLLDFPKQNSFKAFSQNKEIIMSLDQKEGRQTYSIYNESEYNTSSKISKNTSQILVSMANPPLPHKQIRQNNRKQGLTNVKKQVYEDNKYQSNNSEKMILKKHRRGLNKQQIEKQLKQGKDSIKIEGGNMMLRLTSSGHEDNSIKQKVRNKKAQFAELKNEMNSLLP